MPNILDSFPVKLCLTTRDAVERNAQVEREFNAQKITVEPFYALPGETPFKSFNKSQKAMLAYALDYTLDGYDEDGIEHSEPASHALLFENDVVFKSTTRLPYVFEQLPNDWDILYLGANITNGVTDKYSKDLHRIKHAWTTHAVAYSRNVMEYIVEKFDALANHIYDDWLAREVLPKFNCFIVNPMVCVQRPGYSSLWNNMADYTECFEKGDAQMAAL